MLIGIGSNVLFCFLYNKLISIGLYTCTRCICWKSKLNIFPIIMNALHFKSNVCILISCVYISVTNFYKMLFTCLANFSRNLTTISGKPIIPKSDSFCKIKSVKQNVKVLFFIHSTALCLYLFKDLNIFYLLLVSRKGFTLSLCEISSLNFKYRITQIFYIKLHQQWSMCKRISY